MSYVLLQSIGKITFRFLVFFFFFLVLPMKNSIRSSLELKLN